MKTLLLFVCLGISQLTYGQVPNAPLQLTPEFESNPYDPDLPRANMKPVFTWEHDPLTTGYEVCLTGIEHKLSKPTSKDKPCPIVQGNKRYDQSAEFFGCADTCLLSLDIFDSAPSNFNGIHYVAGWILRAYNENGYSAWSPWSFFLVVRPTISSPANGQFLLFPVPNTPTYGWKKGRGDQGMKYDLEVRFYPSNNLRFRITNQRAACGIESCTLRPDQPLNAGEYRVRVRERFGANLGDWSRLSYFRVGI